MQFSISALALLSAAALSSANPLLAHRAQCNADNCARAVTGTNAQPALATRKADCSSFNLVTVSPYPVSSTTIFIGDMAKRQASATATTITPSAVPAYASACSGTARYESACSCFGITKTTTTLPTPVPTVTVTPGPRPVCGSTVQGNGPCGCTYTVTCNQAVSNGRVISTANNISESDCINLVDSYDNSFDGDYNRKTGVCTVYSREDGVETVDDEDSFSFAGTCPQFNNNPNCVVG